MSPLRGSDALLRQALQSPAFLCKPRSVNRRLVGLRDLLRHTVLPVGQQCEGQRMNRMISSATGTNSRQRLLLQTLRRFLLQQRLNIPCEDLRHYLKKLFWFKWFREACDES